MGALPLAPDAQDARVQQLDPPRAVEAIDTANDVVGIARPLDAPAAAGQALAPRRERVDGPEPGLLRAAERHGTDLAGSGREAERGGGGNQGHWLRLLCANRTRTRKQRNRRHARGNTLIFLSNAQHRVEARAVTG